MWLSGIKATRLTLSGLVEANDADFGLRRVALYD
jgi:hypothetical protein